MEIRDLLSKPVWQMTGEAGRTQKRGTRIGRCSMDNKERNITPEEAVILWHASRLDLSKNHEQAPEILKVQGSVIGTLGNFSASIGKAKSKKTFNVSAIVAAALKNGTVLNYTAELPENIPYRECWAGSYRRDTGHGV